MFTVMIGHTEKPLSTALHGYFHQWSDAHVIAVTDIADELSNYLSWCVPDVLLAEAALLNEDVLHRINTNRRKYPSLKIIALGSLLKNQDHETLLADSIDRRLFTVPTQTELLNTIQTLSQPQSSLQEIQSQRVMP